MSVDAVAYPDILPVDDLSPHHSEMAMLRAILEELGMVGWEILYFAVAGTGVETTRQSLWPKFRVKRIAFGGTATQTFTMRIGESLYTFVGGTRFVTFSFPIVIERGVDISFVGGSAQTQHVYLMGSVE